MQAVGKSCRCRRAVPDLVMRGDLAARDLVFGDTDVAKDRDLVEHVLLRDAPVHRAPTANASG